MFNDSILRLFSVLSNSKFGHNLPKKNTFIKGNKRQMTTNNDQITH